MRRLRLSLAALSVIALTAAAEAQISLTDAVDLALRNSPRVKMAQAEVEKARAGVSQAKDVYIPAVNVGAGLGDSYGYSTNPPTLFTITAQSVVYNSAQVDAIRAARSGLDAAVFSLTSVQESVAEDAALSFLALQHDSERQKVVDEENALASRLVAILEDRYSAGHDTQLDLTAARLTAAQFRLSRLHAEDAVADDRDHLARLTALPPATLQVQNTLPPQPTLDLSLTSPQSPAVAAAFAIARAKQELAFGDSRYRYRPQVALFVQYNRYATFANSFAQLQSVYGSTKNHIGANEEAYGVQISIPLYDRFHQAKAQESAAEAARALHEAEYADFQSRDGSSKLRHAMPELQARADVAALEQQYAQLQLDALLLQLNTPAALPSTVTPKDEQNSRIAEREKYLAVLDATYQLHQTQIHLLRQTGQIASWVRPSIPIAGSAPSFPAAIDAQPAKHP